MLAALLGALSLFNAVPAKAQTTVWSGTLTVKTAAGLSGVGCDSSDANDATKCSTTSTLTDDDFTYGSVNYEITRLFVIGTTFGFRLNKAIPSDLKAALTLNIGSSQFALADASLSFSDTQVQWVNSGLSWSVDDTVSLSLVEPPAYTLSVVNASPPCGSTVTNADEQPSYALKLTPAPDMNVEIEYRVVPDNTQPEWLPSQSIEPSGYSIPVRGSTFGQLQQAFPGFKRFEFRLKDTPSVTAECPWTLSLSEDPPTDPDPMPPDTTTETPTTNTGGTGTGGGGGGGVGPPKDTSSPDDDPAPDSPRCGESDREYLEKFYEATGGENWLEKEYWNSQEPLDEWFGVKTDEDGEVISLRLSDNGLSGDMPTEELLCLNENTELKELALWDNEDLSGEVPEDLALAVERAALRYIADMFNINPEWFYDYEDPFNFEDWYERVTTDDEGRVTELHLPGEIPESIRSQFKKRREIIITTSDGGCAVGASSAHVGASGLLAVIFMLLAFSRGLRARQD